RVMAARTVCLMAICRALVMRVGDHAAELRGDPSFLERYRPRECLGLESTGELVLIGGIRPLDRIPDHSDDLHFGESSGHSFGGMRMEHVVPARLEHSCAGATRGCFSPCVGSEREMAEIPAPR